MHHVLLTIVGERRDKNFESNSKFFKEKKGLLELDDKLFDEMFVVVVVE